MPRPTTVSLPATTPATASRLPRRAGRPVLLLVLAAAAAGIATAVLSHDAALVALALALVALLVASVVSLRAQWRAAAPAAPTAPREMRADLAAADPTDELRALRDRYVAAVNSALDDGDVPRARELADAYSDDALRVLTR